MGAAADKKKGIKRRATVIYRRDEKILFVRKRKSKWNLPGGRVEQGESPIQAALREMKEETGLAVEQLRYVSQYQENRVVHFLFEARLKTSQKPRPHNEIEDCRWISAKHLGKQNVREPIKSLIKQFAA
ncbi:MAG: NUDIX domain-containing protein [Pseudomonas sp.]|nr:NUDIX domain-containing protein [Pseudomonas sp.]MDZ4194611.1 NUDIX domain-containing protein [Pseudomonas sp.]